jgi:hypothetical protein
LQAVGEAPVLDAVELLLREEGKHAPRDEGRIKLLIEIGAKVSAMSGDD